MLGKDLLSVLFVCAIDPKALSKVPTHNNAWAVGRRTFEVLGVPAADGAYYLPLSCVQAVFHIQPDCRASAGLEALQRQEIASDLEVQRRLETMHEEVQHDRSSLFEERASRFSYSGADPDAQGVELSDRKPGDTNNTDPGKSEMSSVHSSPLDYYADRRQSASEGIRMTEIFDLDALQSDDEARVDVPNPLSRVNVQNPLNEKKSKGSSRKPRTAELMQDEYESQTIRRATMFSQVTTPTSNPKREARRSTIKPTSNTPN